MVVLIDTNILLDHLQQRHPHAAAATRVWKLAEDNELRAFVSAISFNNVFYIARKQTGSGKALEVVKLIRLTFKLIPLDDQIIDRAIAATLATLKMQFSSPRPNMSAPITSSRETPVTFRMAAFPASPPKSCWRCLRHKF